MNNSVPIFFKPVTNVLYSYDFVQEKSISQEVGKSSSITHIFKTKVSLTFVITDEDQSDIKFNITNLEIGGDYSNDLNEKENNELKKVLEIIKTKFFKFKISDSNNLIPISDFGELRNEMSKIIDSSNNRPLTVAYINMFNNDFFNLFFHRINIANKLVLKPDFTWSNVQFEQLDRPVSYNRNFKVKKVDEKIILLESFSKFNKIIDVKNDSMAMNCVEHGNLKLDTETGIVISDEDDINYEGNKMMGNSNLNMKVKILSTLTCKI